MDKCFLSKGRTIKVHKWRKKRTSGGFERIAPQRGIECPSGQFIIFSM